jgi:hypothetical protein
LIERKGKERKGKERKGFYNPLSLLKPAKVICMYKKSPLNWGPLTTRIVYKKGFLLICMYNKSPLNWGPLTTRIVYKKGFLR